MTADDRLDPGIQRLIAAVDGRPDAMVALALTLLLPRGLTQTARRLCDPAPGPRMGSWSSAGWAGGAGGARSRGIGVR